MSLHRFVAAAVCSALLATPAFSQKITGDKVRIGVLTDMAGPYQDTGGMGSVEAARMAIEDFGGKVLGKSIELVGGDHQNKADVGVTLARKWYDHEGVDAIFDVNHSAIALAINGLVAENGRVVINTGAGSVGLTNEGCTANAVHYVYDTYALATGAARGMARLGGSQARSWYILGVDYAFGKQMAVDLTESVRGAGGRLSGSVFHPLSANDLSSFMLQAQQSKADNIALANAGADAVNAIKTAREFGVTPKQRIVPMLFLINNVHALGLKDAQGIVFTEAFYWNRTPETRTWSRRFFSKMKQMPSMIQAGTYSAVMQYLKAIQAAGTDDGKTVVALMKKTPINDMFASNGRIREDGRMVHDMYLVQVKKPGESQEPWDYYNVLATIPGEEAFQPLSKSKCPLVKR
jgi:branched-chain amino acid transport system substrate-binding protein